MKIICATDFSPHAPSVIRVAIDLARRSAGSVELIHVLDPPSAHIQSPSTDVDAVEQKNRHSNEARLAAEVRRLAETSSVPSTYHLGEGHVEEILLARAKAVAADVIVIGAHGRPMLERTILGSVAERIVRHADRPVLIVPPGAQDLGKGGQASRALRILVALDGRRASEGGVDLVRQLRSRTACDVTFLRLYWPVEEYRRLGLTGARDLAAPDPVIMADLEQTMRTQVGTLSGVGEIHFAVEPTWGDPATGIFVAANEHQADLVVMGAESRHGWARLGHPAVADRVARHAFGVPVMFVPAPAPLAPRSEVPRILTVLAPTDLSATGNQAVPFAYSLVAAHGGVVELCHVHERALPNPPYAYDRPDGQLTAEERIRIEAALRAVVPPDAERMGIATHVTVIDGGQAGEAIVQAAERFAVDAIVLGSHGKGKAKHSFMGSVSGAISRRAGRPVLVVPSLSFEE